MAVNNAGETVTLELTKTEKTKYRALFWASLIVLILFLLFANQWFWLALPFVLTYFVMGWDFI